HGFSHSRTTLRRLHAFGGAYDHDVRILEHFRPTDAGREDWKRLREWTTRSGGGEEPDFPPGVYIGCASPNVITEGGLVSDATHGGWDGGDARGWAPRVAGRASGLLEIVPEPEGDALHATVLIGASPTRPALRALLESALDDGVESLQKAAEGI